MGLNPREIDELLVVLRKHHVLRFAHDGLTVDLHPFGFAEASPPPKNTDEPTDGRLSPANVDDPDLYLASEG